MANIEHWSLFQKQGNNLSQLCVSAALQLNIWQEVMAQYSGNCCALMHSGKMCSTALPETDLFSLLALNTNEGTRNAISTSSTDKIIFRTEIN